MNKTTIIILLAIAAVIIPGGALLLFTYLKNQKDKKPKGTIDDVWVWESYKVGSEKINPDPENDYEQLFWVNDLVKLKGTTVSEFYANNPALNPKITYIPYGTWVQIPKTYKA